MVKIKYTGENIVSTNKAKTISNIRLTKFPFQTEKDNFNRLRLNTDLKLVINPCTVLTEISWLLAVILLLHTSHHTTPSIINLYSLDRTVLDEVVHGTKARNAKHCQSSLKGYISISLRRRSGHSQGAVVVALLRPLYAPPCAACDPQDHTSSLLI